jgi:hypothetical protein
MQWSSAPVVPDRGSASPEGLLGDVDAPFERCLVTLANRPLCAFCNHLLD